MAQKLDTRSMGLDVGLGFVKWLTGAENLHYGLWTGLDVTAGNLGAAQAAYTEKLFGLLPEGRLHILDVGGGAGETARKLVALGHDVEIVVPSTRLAARCRANVPQSRVHVTTFEDFETTEEFDVCLFSESFQYIKLSTALDRALSLLKPRGHILIADCFRSEGFTPGEKTRVVGGGHRIESFRGALSRRPLEVLHEEDITEGVAPSIDLERALFNVIGDTLERVDEELADKRPRTRWLLGRLLSSLISAQRRSRLDARLRGDERNSTVFVENNRYLMVKLRKRGD